MELFKYPTSDPHALREVLSVCLFDATNHPIKKETNDCSYAIKTFEKTKPTGKLKTRQRRDPRGLSLDEFVCFHRGAFVLKFISFEGEIALCNEMLLLLLLLGSLVDINDGGILYPKPSESREVLSLDGIWKFTIANKTNQDKGFIEKWFSKPLQLVIFQL